MTVEEFISTAPLVAISNAELVDITWLCQKFYECEKGTPKEQITFQEVKDRLTNYGALVFNCTPVAQHQGFFYALCSFWSEPVFSKTRNTQKSPLKFSSKGFLYDIQEKRFVINALQKLKLEVIYFTREILS